MHEPPPLTDAPALLPDDAAPSKSQRKRDALALQQLGEQLAALKPSLLQTLDLPEELRQLLLDVQQMPPRGARRRQLRYIGKRLRQLDADTIRAKLDAIINAADASRRQEKQLQKLCDQLLKGDAEALTAFIRNHPQADAQHLRQLIRRARQEQQLDKPPAGRRRLFRYLRDCRRQS